MAIAPGMKDITQGILSSYDARVAEVERLKKETKEMLNGFQASHKEMSTQLRRDLAQGKAKAKSEAKALRSHFRISHKETGSALWKDLAEGVAARKSEVKGMLNDFHRSHKETSAQLRRELAEHNRGIKREVAGMQRETRVDLKEAKVAWQDLAKTMQARRARVEVPPKVEVPVAEEVPDMEAKMLAAIKEHPEGITLAEVAESLGVAPVVLGRVAKSLVGKGEIRKEGKLYLPAGAE